MRRFVLVRGLASPVSWRGAPGATKQAIVTSTARSGQLFDGNGSMPPTFLTTFIAFLPQATHQEHTLTLL